ncbi:5-formyltetrahydrofolate cyclo-ligase [Nannocystaceae bacterium ST9]
MSASPSTIEVKRRVRAELSARRREQLEPLLRARSQALSLRLLAHPLWARARSIAAFVGVRGEPDTHALLERAIAEGKRLWLPRVLDRGVMRFWSCDDLDRLEPGRFGLLEPAMIGMGLGAPGPEHGVDLILVPGLGFARDGARLGFGAGHYDRAFGQRRSEGLPMPILVGIAFEEFIDPPGLPIVMESHDLRMDWLASERGVERCMIPASAAAAS